MYQQQYFNGNSYSDDDPLLSAPSSPIYSSSLYPVLVVEERTKEIREKEGKEGWQREDRDQKGREKEEDVPYPPVEVWRPPTHRWYQKQIVGKTLGKLFLLGGGWTIYAHFRGNSLKALHLPRRLASQIKPNPLIIAAGALCVGIGVFLHFRKYLRDPKAIVKYRKRIFDPTTTFQSTVDEFGWYDLFVIATREELCYKLYQEMQSLRGLYQICSIYKVNNLRAYLRHDVMRAIDVEARWEYDVSRAAERTGPELGIVVQECGEFLLTASRMQADKIRESLEKDPTMVAYSFVDIFTKFDSSIRRIFKKGFLSTEFLRSKLLAQLTADPTFKFSLIAKHRWIVDCLCTPPEIALAFRSARENCSCIVTFLEMYWTWPIEIYQTLIIPDELELAKLKQIHDESEAFCASMRNDIAHATKRYNENIGEAHRAKERRIENVNRETNKQIRQVQLHPQQDNVMLEVVTDMYRRQAEEIEKINEEERVAQRKEQQTKEDLHRNAERQIETKKIELHKEWRAFLAKRRYSGPQIPPYNPIPTYSFISPSAPPM
jgi:hypothetical protein